MTERILLDQGLAPQAAEILCREGFDAGHVSEIGLSKAEDTVILNHCFHEGRTCFTLDHDFHAHLASTRSTAPSVVFLRAEGMDAFAQAGFIKRILSACESQLREGAAVSADRWSVRIRRLPLA